MEPSLIVKGILEFELELIDHPRCLKSWIILKLVENLLGPSIIGFGCKSILIGDHKLFWSCWIRIWVVVPSKSLLFSHLVKLEIWCWSWMSQIFLILYICGWRRVLVGMVLHSLALCLTKPICWERIPLHTDLLSIIFCSRYSIVGMITVLII